MKKTILYIALLFSAISIAQTKEFLVEGSVLTISQIPDLGPESQIQWPAKDITWEAIDATTIRFIKISDKGYFGTGNGYKFSDVALSTSDGLYGTIGASFDDYDEFKVWGKAKLGFNTALGGSSVTTETIALTGGNQTISITDADKVIGFTLISSATSIDITSGHLSGTWMINDNRDVIRCFIQTLEQPFIKMIMASVKIDNTLNEIQITNKTARYWDITGTQPQASLSTNAAPYTLGSIILIKKLD